MTTVTSLNPAKNWTRYGNIDVNPLHPSGVSKVSQLGNGYSKGSEARILPFPNNGQVWRYSYGCCIEKIVFLNNVVLPKTSFGPPQVRSLNLPLSLCGYRVQCFGDVALSCGQGVDITIPVTCSVFEPDPMTSQCTRGVPRLKFGHKIHEMWVFFSFVAIASQKFYRRVAKHHCCFISHGATPGADDVTGQGDLAGWPYLYYRALSCGNIGHINTWKVSWHFFVLRNFNSTFSARNRQNKPSELNLVLLYIN